MAVDYVILDGAVNGEILAGCLACLQEAGKGFITAEIFLPYANSGVMVAFDNEKQVVAGVILVDGVLPSDKEQLSQWLDLPEDSLILVQMAVLTSYRRQGIGTQLISRTLDYACEPFKHFFAVSRVPLDPNLQSSYRLFERLGFREVATVPEFYADSEGFDCPACKSTCRCVGKLMLLHSA